MSLDPVTQAEVALALSETNPEDKQAVRKTVRSLRREHPEDKKAITDLSRCYTDDQDINTCLQSTLAGSPDVEVVTTSSGNYARFRDTATGDTENAEAIKRHQQQVNADPQNTHLRILLIDELIQANRFDEAGFQLVELRSQTGSTLNTLLFDARLAYANDDYQKAVNLFEEASSKFPEVDLNDALITTYERLALTATLTNQPAVSVSALRKLHELDPSNLETLEHLAFAAILASDQSNAVFAADLLMASAETPPPAYTELYAMALNATTNSTAFAVSGNSWIIIQNTDLPPVSIDFSADQDVAGIVERTSDVKKLVAYAHKAAAQNKMELAEQFYEKAIKSNEQTQDFKNGILYADAALFYLVWDGQLSFQQDARFPLPPKALSDIRAEQFGALLQKRREIIVRAIDYLNRTSVSMEAVVSAREDAQRAFYQINKMSSLLDSSQQPGSQPSAGPVIKFQKQDCDATDGPQPTDRDPNYCY